MTQPNIAQDQDVDVEITSDGTAVGTFVKADGTSLGSITALHYDIKAGDVSHVVLEMDWIDMHYLGPGRIHVVPPSGREVLRYWWQGIRRRLRI